MLQPALRQESAWMDVNIVYCLQQIAQVLKLRSGYILHHISHFSLSVGVQVLLCCLRSSMISREAFEPIQMDTLTLISSLPFSTSLYPPKENLNKKYMLSCHQYVIGCKMCPFKIKKMSYLTPFGYPRLR